MMGSNLNLQKHTSYLYSGFLFPLIHPLGFSAASLLFNPFALHQSFHHFTSILSLDSSSHDQLYRADVVIMMFSGYRLDKGR